MQRQVESRREHDRGKVLVAFATSMNFTLYIPAITNSNTQFSSQFLLLSIMSSHLNDTLISQDNNAGSVTVFPWKTVVKGV